MAYQKTEQPGFQTTVMATAAVEARRFIGFNGATCADGAKAIGVNLFKAASGEALTAIVTQIVLIEVGTDVTAGAEITSDAAGKIKPVGAGKLNGYALDAGIAGEQVRVLLAL